MTASDGKRDFGTRLHAAMTAGSLTISDLARWFDRPYSTVHKWLEENREPWGPAGMQACDQLTTLETFIKQRRGLPMPIDLSPPERIKYLAGVRRDARLPKPRTAD